MNFELIFAAGLPVFLAALGAHVLHWRTKRPRRDVVALCATFLILPALLIFSIPFLPIGPGVLDLEEAFAAYLLHFGLSGVYISSYPAFQAVSPSLQILQLFKTSGSGGLSRAEIFQGFDPTSIVSARVRDLEDSNLIKRQGRGFALTWRGRAVAGLYSLYRKSLGL